MWTIGKAASQLMAMHIALESLPPIVDIPAWKTAQATQPTNPKKGKSRAKTKAARKQKAGRK